MTDLERFVELYRSFGIECVIETTENAHHITLDGGGRRQQSHPTYSNKFFGSAHTCITFGLDGTFDSQFFDED